MDFRFKPKTSAATFSIYAEAIRVGMAVKVAYVRLFDNWDYTVTVTDYRAEQFRVDRRKRYDRATTCRR